MHRKLITVIAAAALVLTLSGTVFAGRDSAPGQRIAEACGTNFGQFLKANKDFHPKGGAKAFSQPDSIAEHCPGGEEGPADVPDESDPPSDPAVEFAGDTVGVRYQGESADAEVFLGDNDLAVAGNSAEAEQAWQDSTYGIEFSYDGSRLRTLVDGPGNDVFLSRSATATCGAWDTVRITIADAAPGASTAFVGVTLDGAALGDLQDDGDADADSHQWAFTVDDMRGGFTLTGDLVIAGWAGTDPDLANLEITVGCAA